MTSILRPLQDRQINILSEMLEFIVDEVSSAELVEICPNWDEETESVICAIVFSTGTRQYKVAFDWLGTIVDYSPKIPKHLLVDIHNGICAGYLKGILDEATKECGE